MKGKEAWTFTSDKARSFYDGFGAKQDKQTFYEQVPLDSLVGHLDLDSARSVLEFGCGTGRLGAELVRAHTELTYTGLDISSTMVALSRTRLEPFGDRATVHQADGTMRIDAADGAFDRVISTYVLDLLAPADIDAFVDEAQRVLRPGGLLGLVSLTQGARGAPWLVSKVWNTVHRFAPAVVGGCRPITLSHTLGTNGWRVTYRAIETPWAIASEVLVAQRIASSLA